MLVYVREDCDSLRNHVNLLCGLDSLAAGKISTSRPGACMQARLWVSRWLSSSTAAA